MKINDFKSGSWIQQYKYKSFSPANINHAWEIDDDKLNFYLSLTNIKLGELNAYSMLIPDIDFFIRMHIKKEATTSSRIEGTQTNMEEAFQKIENVDPEKRNDWLEVNNYVDAMNHSIAQLAILPLSNRLLKNAHKILLSGVRGENKNRGEFRRSQNWLGGASLNDAVYIPPHHNEIVDLMSDLEKFLHNDDLYVPDLIKIGIAHYQFETIHPFLDGNGRIGRLLITLYLVSRNILVKPTLYLSDFFDHNKLLYYDNLTRVRNDNNLNQWLLFFLEGIRQTADHSIITFTKIIALRTNIEQQRLTKLGKKTKSAQTLLIHLFSNPVVDSSDIAGALSVNISTAMRMIDDFIELAILKETTGYKRNRIFIFDEYVKIFE